jgi:hypothetical protein
LSLTKISVQAYCKNNILAIEKYRVTIKEIDTFNVIKTVSIVDRQFG